jgi:hypothetical protein
LNAETRWPGSSRLGIRMIRCVRISTGRPRSHNVDLALRMHSRNRARLRSSTVHQAIR